jgi:hypothetical protein
MRATAAPHRLTAGSIRLQTIGSLIYEKPKTDLQSWQISGCKGIVPGSLHLVGFNLQVPQFLAQDLFSNGYTLQQRNLSIFSAYGKPVWSSTMRKPTDARYKRVL